MPPLPAWASPSNFGGGHPRSWSGALNPAPYAPALEPVTKTSTGLTKSSRAHFSTTRAFSNPRCSTCGGYSCAAPPQWTSQLQYDTNTMFQPLNGLLGLPTPANPTWTLFGLS